MVPLSVSVVCDKPTLFKTQAHHNIRKQADTVTNSKDKQVCNSHLNSNHSVAFVNVCVLFSSQADSAAYGEGERRGSGQRNGGPAG